MALPTLQSSLSDGRAVERQPVLSSPATTDLGTIFQRAGVSDDLHAIEEYLLERTAARASQLAAAGAHTIAAGGKRLRAALVLLTARLGAYDLERARHPAAAVELLHTASLVHDDLVDHAHRRRGHITVHARWSNTVALMLGDYFFAVSANELAAEPDPRIIRFYADAAQTLVEGELSPVTLLTPFEEARSQYVHKIGSKTAALFEAACKAGIAVASGSDEQIETLGHFGYELGLAFQIVDDVLDFVGDEQTLGKPAGHDLREGTWTLPLLHAVAVSTHPLLIEFARNPYPPAPASVPLIVDLVIAEGGVSRALDDARAIVAHALRRLDNFPPSKASHALADICAFVLNRQK